MAGNPEYQSLDPQGAPDPVTPAAGPGDPAGYGMVTPHGRGTAPYDIQADNGQAAIQAAYDSAGAVSAAGVSVYGTQSPRQAATEQLLYSPQGFSAGGGLSGFDILQGWSGEPDESWANDVQPPSLLETPIQGQMGTYPSATSTMQEGIETYGC